MRSSIANLNHETATAGRNLRAAAIIAAAAGALFVVSACREPLLPLRLLARWSLERRGARFLELGPARLQSSLDDCGPTALADLLGILGLPVPADDSLRRLASTTVAGTSLPNLEAAAADAGLRLFPVRWDPADLPQLPLPSLVWVERNHFVVVARRGEVDSLEIHDPAAGRYRMTGARFARLWSGVALVLRDSVSTMRRPENTTGTYITRPRVARAINSRTTES